jgi:D-aminoacyl-tRNA deacylase
LDVEIKNKLKINPKQIIFISRHTSKTGTPTLTVHPIGNFREAKFGGNPKTLVKSSPRLMTELLRILDKNANNAKTYHKVCFEVTHHGPYLKTPTLFIEVGSTEAEWKKIKPAEIVADSVLELITKYKFEDDMPKDIPVLIGVGGGHYAPRFTDVALAKKSAFGHMIPMYHINKGNIADETLQKAIDKTPDVKGIYIHRKSMKKSQVTEFRNRFENLGLPTLSSKELEDI